LAINLDQTPVRVAVSGPADVYALTSPELQSKTVLLNGQALAMGQGDTLPAMTPKRVDANEVILAPVSVNFMVLPNAQNPNCSA
jgi:hypothetical protein